MGSVLSVYFVYYLTYFFLWPTNNVTVTLRIAQMLVDVGAIVDGVADRLVPGDKDIFLYEGFETLWEVLHNSQKQT